MKTKTINLYQFNELSEDAKEKAIDNLSTINIDFDWWEYTFEDAENIGLKITSFEIYRYCHGNFINSATECAKSIIINHGLNCETYNTANDFLNSLNELTSKFDDTEECPEDETETLEEEFLRSLLEDYRMILDKEYEYQTSRQAIIETIEANDYYFTEDGKLEGE